MVLREGTATVWYLKPGQTLENTKVIERKHALVASSPAWRKIIGQLDQKRIEQEAQEVENARKQEMKDINEQLIKSFNLKKIHIKQETPEDVLKQRQEEYFFLRKEQEKEREKFVQDIRKNMFIKSGEVKNLDRALLHSEVLYERSQQKQYVDYLAVYENAEDEKNKKIDKMKDEEELQKQLDDAKKQIEKSARYQQEILKQIKENLERRKAEKAEEFIKAIEDNRNMARHMAEIDQIECRQIKLAKEKVKQQALEAKAKREAEKLQRIKEDEEIDKIYGIYAAAKCKIDNLRKDKEKEIIQKKIARREVVQGKINAAAEERKAEEQRVMEKYFKEAEARELKQLRKEEEKRLKLKQEQEENVRKMREEIAKQKYNDGEIEKWERLNQIKQKEVMKKLDEIRRLKMCKESRQHDMDLLKQIQERDEATKKERQELIDHEIAEQEKWKKSDEMFLTYGEECLKYAKDRGRTTYPIEKVIAKYKKEHNLGDPVPKWHCTHYISNRNICPPVKLEDKVKTSPIVKPTIKRSRLVKQTSADAHHCEFCV